MTVNCNNGYFRMKSGIYLENIKPLLERKPWVTLLTSKRSVAFNKYLVIRNGGAIDEDDKPPLLGTMWTHDYLVCGPFFPILYDYPEHVRHYLHEENRYITYRKLRFRITRAKLDIHLKRMGYKACVQ